MGKLWQLPNVIRTEQWFETSLKNDQILQCRNNYCGWCKIFTNFRRLSKFAHPHVANNLDCAFAGVPHASEAKRTKLKKRNETAETRWNDAERKNVNHRGARKIKRRHPSKNKFGINATQPSTRSTKHINPRSNTGPHHTSWHWTQQPKNQWQQPREEGKWGKPSVELIQSTSWLSIKFTKSRSVQTGLSLRDRENNYF